MAKNFRIKTLFDLITQLTLLFYSYDMQPDRVTEFCKKNKLQLIIRAHECVMDGFERFAQGQLITLFSATNYCGKHNSVLVLCFACDFSSVLLMIEAACRDGKQCWSHIGSRKGFGCGTQVNSSLTTPPSISWDISWAYHGWDLDAGKLFPADFKNTKLILSFFLANFLFIIF